MLKIVSSILAFGFISLYAGGGGGGGGGHSFGGDSTSNKFGDNKNGTGVIEIPNSSDTSCAQNIKISTTSNVRYKNYLYLIHDWKGGYATTTVTHCGLPKKINTLQITQYTVDLIYPTKAASKLLYNDSYIKLETKLVDASGEIHTVHSVRHGSYSKHINTFNEWGGLGDNKTASKEVYTW